ncbi:MAG: helix-turn-helix transcriptional regulator [Kutzneria sp.]|nr:helix-turn-helix transcriptional regulator [Kutzneria sp.]
MTLLLREAIGDRLRHTRTSQHRTLREVSRAARVSLGYLSEVERGRKEASSELLAAICDALELPLADLLHTVASDMSLVSEVTGDKPAGVAAGHRGAIEGGRPVPGMIGDQLSDLRSRPALTPRLSRPISQAGGKVVVAA